MFRGVRSLSATPALPADTVLTPAPEAGKGTFPSGHAPPRTLRFPRAPPTLLPPAPRLLPLLAGPLICWGFPRGPGASRVHTQAGLLCVWGRPGAPGEMAGGRGHFPHGLLRAGALQRAASTPAGVTSPEPGAGLPGGGEAGMGAPSPGERWGGLGLTADAVPRAPQPWGQAGKVRVLQVACRLSAATEGSGGPSPHGAGTGNRGARSGAWVPLCPPGRSEKPEAFPSP